MSERKQSVWAIIMQKLDMRVTEAGQFKAHSPDMFRALAVIGTLLDVLRECELTGHGRDYVLTNLRTLASNAEVIAEHAEWSRLEGGVDPRTMICELLAQLE